ncbi:MAG: tryptophan synthase subunit alpha, partial [Dehalococcoidia bacterium]|nr:tryptophan synthase subunit alpha [Dehalococcoidia bacterium]
GYMTVGYPRIEDTVPIVSALAEAGCDIVELGIPFSDPLADGATIQAASQQALKQGVNTSICLETASNLRQRVKIPLLFMTYFNPVLRFGLDAFCRKSEESGIDGFIVPDLPPEDGAELERVASKHDLDIVYLLAPTSTEERIDLVASRSKGFIYLVSLTGVTGARQDLPAELEQFVRRVRQKARQPLCVGFGISTPEQAGRVAAIADGVIVGSRLIELVSKDDGAYTQTRAFVRSLRRALDESAKKPGTIG